MMEYDKKTLQAVLILLTENPEGRTEAYEHTVAWIQKQLKPTKYSGNQVWETYNA